MNASVRRDFERAVSIKSVTAEAESRKLKANGFPKWFQIGFVNDFAAAARVLRIEPTEGARHASTGEIMSVAGEPDKRRLRQLKMWQARTVRWVWQMLAGNKLPTVEAILARFVFEKRKTMAWKVRGLMKVYGSAAWTVLRERFKIARNDQIDDAPVEGPFGLKQMMATLTARTGKARTERAENTEAAA
jgi:hypothetical protein